MYEMDGVPATPMMNTNGLELLDIFDSNENNIIDIDQFVNLIRGTESPNFLNFDLINGCFADNQFGPTSAAATPGDLFGFGQISGNDPNSVLNTLPSFDHGEEVKGDGDQEEQDDEENRHSSETNTGSITSSAKNGRAKGDRSRTLMSERKRRGSMKEKLYALRALVPNITKMDKASIVGDAVLYVQNLQTQAKKLEEEIGDLEASLLGPDQRYQGSNVVNNVPRTTIHISNTTQSIPKIIIQMDMFQVDERGFYMRLVCNKGKGIGASLYKVLESLTSFKVQTSNLASAADRFELTVTLHVKDSVREMSLPNSKLWVVGALLNQGFEFKSPFTP
ncbi:hypothetical protein UlMin_028987 [Ulmus minor]